MSPPAADDAAAHAAGHALPDDESLPVAATLVLARDGRAGAEVLLLRRPDRGSFPGGWVFPGGRLEAADEDPAAPADVEAAARRAAVRETWEEAGLILDPAALVTLSRWHPPTGIPLRIRTWFFLGPAPAGELSLAPDEAVDAAWLTPDEALSRHARGRLTLYPPTWVTLYDLRGAAGADALLARARRAGVRRFETRQRPAEDGAMMLWREDGEYDPDAAPPASGDHRPRHRLRIGSLPWVYERDF
ncbi:NUDIX domain-containing protein [Microbacterium aureliae]